MALNADPVPEVLDSILGTINTSISPPVIDALADLSSTNSSIRLSPVGSFEMKAIAFFPRTGPMGSGSRPEGFIMFDYAGDGAARIEVRLGNFPSGKGPFSYHIHESRVPDEITEPLTQCKDAKAHLDPTKRGEVTPCDSNRRETCQVGDLAGKYGKVPEYIQSNQVFRETYEDTSLSWTPSNPAFFADKSIVIHVASDKSRIACANIMVL